MVLTALRSTPDNTLLNRTSGDNTSSDSNAALSPQQRETAQYAADMILELRNIAKSAKLFQIMVPLEYAYYEAFSAANQVIVPAGEAQRIRELSRIAEQDCVPEPEDY